LSKEKSKRKQDFQIKWEDILLEEFFLEEVVEEAVVMAVVATGIGSRRKNIEQNWKA
jgi:hypothetical protein